MRSSLYAFVVAAPLAVGCAPARPFTPADADTESSQGHAAAHYEVKTGASDWGAVQITVWTEGAEDRKPPAGASAEAGAFVRVAAEVLNDWDQPVRLSLESARLTALDREGNELPAAAPAEHSPAEPVAKGEERTYRAGFIVPGARAAGLRSFEVRWTLRSGENTYTRKTRFVREADGDGYYYWPYDPFWYGSFGAASRVRSRGGWGSGVSIGLGVGYGD